MKKEIEPIDEVLGYLKSLKATWEKAIALAQKEEMVSGTLYRGNRYRERDI